jgi:hypothetical protein
MTVDNVTKLKKNGVFNSSIGSTENNASVSSSTPLPLTMSMLVTLRASLLPPACKPASTVSASCLHGSPLRIKNTKQGEKGTEGTEGKGKDKREGEKG